MTGHGPPPEVRAVSFGSVAERYDRYRPGPVPEVLEWLLPPAAEVVVDLGAGTGAVTRLLVERVATVVAVEPDDRMRAVLAARVPAAEARAGTGEAIPVATGAADAVVAASSWHWMAESALSEVARVIRPGGILGVLWSGPVWDGGQRDGALRALALLRRAGGHGRPRQSREGPARRLVVPAGGPFAKPESAEFSWTLPMTADELVGLLGTYSGVILLPEGERTTLMDTARAVLSAEPALRDGGTLSVPFRARCWRARRLEASL